MAEASSTQCSAASSPEADRQRSNSVGLRPQLMVPAAAAAAVGITEGSPLSPISVRTTGSKRFSESSSGMMVDSFLGPSYRMARMGDIDWTNAEKRPVHPNANEVIRYIALDDVAEFEHAIHIHEVPLEICLTLDMNPYRWKVQHYAAANDSFRVLEWLFEEHDVDFNVQTSDNRWTPMHFAAYNDAERACTFLRHALANTELRDVYGDRPCDVAHVLGHDRTAEILGDDSAAKAKREQEQAEMEALQREARLADEERAKALLREKQMKEESENRARRRAERIRKNKEVRAVLEVERIGVLKRALEGREIMGRDEIEEAEWMMASYILIGHDIEFARVEYLVQEKEKREREMEAARRTAVTPQGKKKKKKSGGGSAKKKRGSSSSPDGRAGTVKGSDTSPDGRASTSATGKGEGGKKSGLEATEDNEEGEEELPVISGNLTKAKKLELIRLRNKILKERQARAEKRLRARLEQEKVFKKERAAFEEEESKARMLNVMAPWQVGLTEVLLSDPTLDSKHPEDYVYHVEDCTCGGVDCTAGTFSWVCCGRQKVNDLGCDALDDTMRPPYHTGSYTFHLSDCTCSAEKKKKPPASDQEDSVAPSVETVGAAGKVTFCNPGGFVWSCCGSLQPDSEGCVFYRRFFYAPNHFYDQKFFSGDPADCIEIGPQGNTAKHKMPYSPLRTNSMYRSTIFGNVLFDPKTCARSVLCYEVVVDACPVPTVANEERMVIGLIPFRHTPDESHFESSIILGSTTYKREPSQMIGSAKYPSTNTYASAVHDGILNQETLEDLYDTRFTDGSFISSSDVGGIGWWAHTKYVRGRRYQLEADEPYKAGDIVTVVLDFENHSLMFFRNRSMAFHMMFPVAQAFLPAITLTPGCAVSIDTSFKRTHLVYVDIYMRDREAQEKAFRLAHFGRGRQKNLEYAAMYRQISRRRGKHSGAGVSSSSVGSPTAAREEDGQEEDDGTIAFDI